MSAEDFEVLRQHMLAEISAVTFQMRDLIGNDSSISPRLTRSPAPPFVFLASAFASAVPAVHDTKS